MALLLLVGCAGGLYGTVLGYTHWSVFRFASASAFIQSAKLGDRSNNGGIDFCADNAERCGDAEQRLFLAKRLHYRSEYESARAGQSLAFNLMAVSGGLTSLQLLALLTLLLRGNILRRASTL